MASTITHAYFVMDMYDKLDITTKSLLVDKKEHLKTFAQNMDALFFYDIIRYNKGRRIREFGSYFHDNDTYLFFETLINYIKYNGYGHNGEVMAFLYGMISHYVLDSNIHPFVIYKTGEFDKNNRNTYKYNMLHPHFESLFDNYLIKIRENIVPYKFKCYKYCFNVNRFDKDLKEVINFTYKEVFDINNMSKFYLKSIRDMRSFYKIFRYDPYGIKKKFYKLVDKVSPDSFRKKSPLSYNHKVDTSMFNLEHKVWYNPTSKRISSHESILEIYTRSLNECVTLINDINNYIYDDIGNIKKFLKNVSYKTGRDTDKHYELKYFEY